MKVRSKFLGTVAAAALGWSASANATVDWGMVNELYYGISYGINEYCYGFYWSDPPGFYACVIGRRYGAGLDLISMAPSYPGDMGDSMYVAGLMLMGSSS